MNGKEIEHIYKIKEEIDAGVAELGKGTGLRTLSRRSPRVQITPPA